MGIPLVPKLLRAHLAELAENDSRHDGRGRFEGRDLELEIDCLERAEGSLEFEWEIQSFTPGSNSRS